MVEINSWAKQLLEKVQAAFKANLLFFGLQGSYRRGEATPGSDIDIVVILADLDMPALQTYKELVATMPQSEKACGFIGGREELLHWPKHELFQLGQDTKAYYGNLSELFPEISRQDIVQSAKVGASTLYHAACHTFLYGQPQEHAEALRGFYKGAFFILQVAHYLRSGEYISQKQALLALLSGQEKEILAISANTDSYKQAFAEQPATYYAKIIDWSSSILKSEF